MKKRLLKAFFLFNLLVLVALIAGFWWLYPGRGPIESVDVSAKAYLEEIEGTKVLHLKGSPYEMGYQRGVLVGDTVRLSMAKFDELLDMAKEEMGLPKVASYLILDLVYALCAPYIPDRYKRELEGIADGAGVSLQMLRRGQVVSVVTERNCSSFAAFGPATAGGKLYQSRNLDWITDAGIQKSAVLCCYEPDGLKPFVTVGYAAFIGALSGMSMEGISIAQIGATTKNASYRGTPLAMLMRRVLEEASDLNDAEAIIRNAKRTVGYNYVVADGDAPAAIALETNARQCAVFKDNDPKETVEYAIPIAGAVMRADEAMDPEVRAAQTCAKAPGLPYGSNSYDHRYKGMATRIQENYGKIDAAAALEIAKATAMEGVNLHSVLYATTDREMWVAHAGDGIDASKQPYVHYNLKELFKRPEERTPAQ